MNITDSFVDDSNVTKRTKERTKKMLENMFESEKNMNEILENENHKQVIMKKKTSEENFKKWSDLFDGVENSNDIDCLDCLVDDFIENNQLTDSAELSSAIWYFIQKQKDI